MRKVRYIGTFPQEGLGTLLRPGDVVEVSEDVATDLFRREGQFEEATDDQAASPVEDDES